MGEVLTRYDQGVDVLEGRRVLAALWTASEAMPGREHPDASKPPSGRVEAGSVLIELERVGGWIRVESPQGQRFWVDGRRLVAAASVPRPSPAEPSTPVTSPPDLIAPPPPVPTPPPEVSRSAAAASKGRRRLPLLLLAATAGAVVLIAASLLLFRSDSGFPTVLRGYVPLEFQPTELGRGVVRSDSFYLSEGETLAGITLSKDEITVTPLSTSGTDELAALSSVGLRPAAIASGSSVLLLEAFTTGMKGSVTLPSDDCCANSLVGTDNGVIVFPEESGRSDSYLEYDKYRDSWRQTTLPRAVAVTSVLFFDGFLYVGHTDGLLAVSPYDGCSDPVNIWDRPTAALAVSNLDQVRPIIGALDITTDWIAMIDPGITFYHEVTDCNGVKAPELEAIVDIGGLGADPVSYQPTLALLGSMAYVIDADGKVYVADVGSAEADLHRAIQLPGGPGVGASLVAVPDWLSGESGLWSVFVTDPAGERLWWIATGGNESPLEPIEPIREFQ